MDELIARVREVLSTTPDRWRTLTASVELELLERRPAPEEWSAAECLQHLLDTELGAFSVRLQAFLEGRFGEARTRSLASLSVVTEADLERTALHPELGQVTLREMLNEWAGHDLMHTVQAERAVMQPFIVGSGPWRSYFADYDAGAGES